MHSLSFSGDTPTELTEAMAAPGFSLVMLDEPPLTINFQLTLPDGDDGAGIDSLVEDAVGQTWHAVDPPLEGLEGLTWDIPAEDNLDVEYVQR